jgi:hypothetical protein
MGNLRLPLSTGKLLNLASSTKVGMICYLYGVPSSHMGGMRDINAEQDRLRVERCHLR